MSDIDRLLAIASEATFAGGGLGEKRLASYPSLVTLLGRRNGFVAFESALEVFGVGDSGGGHVELCAWNFSGSPWRRSYGALPDDLLAFAQDVLGVQFLIDRDGAVFTFEPEAGSVETFAGTLDGWAEEIMSDYSVHTGWPLAHAWQIEHGAIRAGYRLAPRTPFIFGGEYVVENLRAVSAPDAMLLYGSVYAATRDRADGEEILWSDPLASKLR